MKNFKHLALWGFASVLLLSGCQDEDFGYSSEEIAVKTSFEKTFGTLNPDQIWDFSSYNLNKLGLAGGPGYATTRADGKTDPIKQDIATTIPRYYQVPGELRTWIDKNLREEVYNKKRGTTNFTLKMPEDRDIIIIPIYQGQAGMIYNLCLKSEETPAVFTEGYIWEKSQGIQIKNDEGEYVDLIGKDFNNHTVGRDVQSKPVRVLHEKVQGSFSLYLDIQNLDDAWDGQQGLPFRETFSDKQKPGSTDGQMVAVSLKNSPATYAAVQTALQQAFADPENPTEGQYTFENFMIIGCEDSNLPRNIAGDNDPRLVGTDWDYNDLIFLVVGVTNEDVVYTKDEIISKRYMIEDLGSSYDYDFNDIVIDVTQRKHTDENGEVSVTQNLSLKHLCGTIPWRVKVGDYVSPILPGRNDNTNPKGYDPAVGTTEKPNDPYEEIIDVVITGWDPDLNNIVVTAWPNAAGEDIAQGETDWSEQQKVNYLKDVDGTSYSFPEVGAYPFMIACDITQPWNDEHQTIAAEAIITWKKPGYETIVTPGEGSGSGGGEGGDGSPEVEDDGYNSIQVVLPITPDEDGNIIADSLNILFDSWLDDIIINPEFLQGIEAGYRIVTTFEITDETKKHLMYMKMEAPWENIGGFNLDDEQTTLEIQVSPGNLNLLKTYGVALKGINVRIKKIEILKDDWGVTSLPWNGNASVDWTNYLAVMPECFENAKPGDRLIVNGNGTIRLAYINPEGGYTDIGTVPADGFTLTADIIEGLKQNGLALVGHENWGTINHIEIYTPVYVTLTFSVEGPGTIQGAASGQFEVGKSFNVTATPNEHSRFLGWTDGETNAQRTITVGDAAATYTARFEAIPQYHVSVTVDEESEGSGTVTGTGDYYQGSNYTITATPDANSKFVRWNDGNTEASRMIANIQAAASYSALFALKEYEITVNSNNSEGGTVSGSGTYKHGQKITISATAADGYIFASWNDGNTNASREVEVTGPATYTANFVAAGPVNIFSGSQTMNNWGGGSFNLDKTKVAQAIQDGKTTMTINFSSCSTSYDMYLQTGWSQAIGTPSEVTVTPTTESVTFTFVASDAAKVSEQGIQILVKANSSTTGGQPIVISSIDME